MHKYRLERLIFRFLTLATRMLYEQNWRKPRMPNNPSHLSQAHRRSRTTIRMRTHSKK